MREVPSYDVAVIGVGSMGSATCYELAKRGARVLGLEQFDIPHAMGSHGGQSRLIRQAYFEQIDYVPLLFRAYEKWRGLEQASGAKLLFQTGLRYYGRPQDSMLQGVRTSGSPHEVTLHAHTCREAMEQYEGFDIPDGYEMILEPAGGFVLSERAIATYYSLALQLGADIRTNTALLTWKEDGDGVVLDTKEGQFRANRVVFAAGAWTKNLVSLPLKVTRQTLAWVQPKRWDAFELDRFPCWLWQDHETEGIFYGFPMVPTRVADGPVGLKIAHHMPAREFDPDLGHRDTAEADYASVIRFMDKCMAGRIERVLSSRSCLYTYSDDEHFVIDCLPGYDNKVIIAAGFSGHGFKFVPFIGEVLSDLALDGRTAWPIEFLRMNRLASPS